MTILLCSLWYVIIPSMGYLSWCYALTFAQLCNTGGITNSFVAIRFGEGRYEAFVKDPTSLLKVSLHRWNSSQRFHKMNIG